MTILSALPLFAALAGTPGAIESDGPAVVKVGEHAITQEMVDAALIGMPESDLERSAGIVHEAATERATKPDLIWAPLVEHDPSLRIKLRNIAVYAAINSAPVVRESWDLDDEAVYELSLEVTNTSWAEMRISSDGQHRLRTFNWYPHLQREEDMTLV